jgi:hypothetical protein
VTTPADRSYVPAAGHDWALPTEAGLADPREVGHRAILLGQVAYCRATA